MNLAISVLLVGKDVAWAAKLQRVIASEGMAAYFVMSLARARQAVRELDPDLVVVDGEIEGRPMLFFQWLRRERPGVGRVLLTALSKSLFERELAGGVVDAVAYERDLLPAIARVSMGAAEVSAESTSYAIRRTKTPPDTGTAWLRRAHDRKAMEDES